MVYTKKKKGKKRKEKIYLAGHYIEEQTITESWNTLG